MTDDSASPERVVASHMRDVVPERATEFDELWRRYNPKVTIVPSAGGIKLEADKDHIVFDLKTMDVFWIIGFAGWRAIETYSPQVVASAKFGHPISDVLKIDEGLQDVERAYKERRAAAQKLIEVADPALAPWPPDLPRPSADRDALDDEQYKAAFDLTCMAVAFTLFHEFRHVMFYKDKARPSDRREEELACDIWAREFMTAKLASYANEHNHTYREVLQKRSMALALAALILHEITPELEHGGNKEYFSLATRLQAILDNTPLPEDSHFWVFAASLLIGFLRQRNIVIDAPAVSPSELTRRLIGML